MSEKMTATERLRALLDKRGVEWHGVEDSTYWGEVLLTRRDGSDPVYKFRAHKTANRLSVHLLQVTPEQAIEATLGPAVPPPEPPDVPYDILIDELRDTWGIEASWDGLRKFWYLGWTDEHVEDMGRLHDELRDAIVELLGDRCDWVQTGVTHAHNVLDKASHAGRGTCRMERVDDEQRILHGWLECSECGPVYPPVNDAIAKAVAFCPFCGRKVVE